MSLENICLHCGACCAFFRVSFYWRDADPTQGGKIPSDLVEEESEFLDNMKGTNQSHPYCAALSGKIGKRVACTIYAERPSPCSEFGIHISNGKIQIDPTDIERCNRARAAWHLPPLTKDQLMPEQVHRGVSRMVEKLVEDARQNRFLHRQPQAPRTHVHHFFGR